MVQVCSPSLRILPGFFSGSVVFLPLFGLEGLEGKLYKPLALNMAYSMIGALILTFTIIPVLASLLLKPGMAEHEPKLVRWIKRPYRPALQYVLRHPWGTMSLAGLLFVSSLALLPFFGTEFMPTLEEGSIMFRVTSIPSTSLSQSIKIAERLETAVKQFPEVEEAFSMIGRAERGESADMNYAELQINLKPKTHWRPGLTKEQLVEDMRQVMEKTEPTSLYAYTQPIQMRVEELISGVRATLAVKGSEKESDSNKTFNISMVERRGSLIQV